MNPDSSRGPAEPVLVARLRAAGCVFAEDEAALIEAATADEAERERLVAARVAGEPLEYLLGWAEFAGLRIGVLPGVFVPRRRTELLLELALAAAAGIQKAPLVLELCCGAAPLGTALATRLPGARILAADLDPDAVAAARRNLAPFGERTEAFEGDLFAPVPTALRAAFDIIAVNAPYVPSEEIALMPPEAREHEHLIALDGGADGLALHRRIAAEAAVWLAPDGTLVIETSEPQAPLTLALFAASGLAARVVHDEERYATAVVAQRSSPS